MNSHEAKLLLFQNREVFDAYIEDVKNQERRITLKKIIIRPRGEAHNMAVRMLAATKPSIQEEVFPTEADQVILEQEKGEL